MASSSGQPANSAVARAGNADDYALMVGVRAGDSAAFSSLYDRFGSVIYSLCLRALRDPRDAEDLLIDIFWEVWERADRYDAGRGSPATYLLGLARSRVVDRLRSRKSRRRISAESSSDSLETARDTRPSGMTPLEATSLAERGERVRQAMAGLTAPQRQALEMAFFDSMTHTEVAMELREPVGTIKSRIRQALMQLRKVLGGEPFVV